MKKTMQNKKGFTLAELLIVVAIIAVLVSISIPIFSTQLEKAREATDAANIRSAYAEVVAASLEDPDHDHMATVSLKQQIDGWQTETLELGSIGGISVSADDDSMGIEASANGSVIVAYVAKTQSVTIGGMVAG